LDILFEQLYNNYYPKLIAYASLHLESDEAHDVVQDVFLSLLEEKNKKLEESTLNAYLYRAVQNKCIDVIRHKTVKKQYQTRVGERFLQMESEYFYSSRNEIEERLLSQELQEQIDAAIEALPPKGKIVFKLFFLETKTAKEIGSILGLSVSTVENHIYTCTKALRQKLAKYALILHMIYLFS
jgi:RNA polymerase sigma-70 factor (ECF subfamily)